jgi:DNA-binding NtrC family response regulator
MKNTERFTLTVTDATDGDDGPFDGPRTSLLELCTILRQYGMSAELVEHDYGTSFELAIESPSLTALIEAKEARARSGRPRKSESWPEGLDTDEVRLQWLMAQDAEDAMQTLGISRRTLYRRIDELKRKVHGIA